MMNPVVDASTSLEDELLLCCARVSLGSEVQARITELLQQPLNWETVLNRAWWHRIRPLTHVHLCAQPVGTVPEHVLAELAEHADELSKRNQRLSKALADVATFFEDARLRAVVFKGPTLTQDAYGDLALRECGDLDLLVCKDDFPKVAEMLVSHGFKSWWERDDKNQQVFACEFERSDATLDVHWNLSPEWLNYRVDFDRLWESGIPLSSGGQLMRKLQPEDAIAVLCIHGTKHWWERLRWICDVAEVVNSGLITDWDGVKTAAVQARCLRSVSLGLWLASDLLSANLPADAMRRFDFTPTIKRLGAQVRTWLGYAEQGGEMRKLRERFLFRMGVCERMRDRVPQIVHYLVARPPSQHEPVLPQSIRGA